MQPNGHLWCWWQPLGHTNRHLGLLNLLDQSGLEIQVSSGTNPVSEGVRKLGFKCTGWCSVDGLNAPCKFCPSEETE